jgi:hypothetical protein
MDLFNEENRVKPLFVKWGKVGDYIAGTLINVKHIKSTLPGKEGQDQKIYEILTEAPDENHKDFGQYHELDDKKNALPDATKVKPGKIYLVGGKFDIDDAMLHAKLGQFVVMKFLEERPNKKKGYNPSKVVQVWLHEENKRWQESRGLSVGDLSNAE